MARYDATTGRMSFGSTTVFLPMSYEVAHFVQGEVWVERSILKLS